MRDCHVNFTAKQIQVFLIHVHIIFVIQYNITCLPLRDIYLYPWLENN
jgi:hypothetical protein